MAQIDVDFDVFKSLTSMRRDESDTINHVLRRLLDLKSAPGSTAASSTPGASFKGVEFPNGTQFRATYKGKMHKGEIKGGLWLDENGEPQSSPSQAAYKITGSGINGWRFWEAKRPTDAGWEVIDNLRQRSASLV